MCGPEEDKVMVILMVFYNKEGDQFLVNARSRECSRQQMGIQSKGKDQRMGLEKGDGVGGWVEDITKMQVKVLSLRHCDQLGVEMTG